MRERVEQLASGYFAGTLSEDEQSELRELMRSDHELLSVFCDEAEFESVLGEVTETLDRPQKRSRLFQMKWAVAAALLLAAGMSLLFYANRRPEVLAEMTVAPRAVITVSGQSDDRTAAGLLQKGATIRLAQGSAEVMLHEGVRCLLEAPGELTLEERGLVSLHAGRARFEVEERARGFRVLSGDLEVLDLGTEFGVDASAKTPEVHVLEGLVIGKSRQRSGEETRIEGGSAVVMAREGRLKPIPIDEKRFTSRLGTGLPVLRLSFDRFEGSVDWASGSIARRDGVHVVLDEHHPPEVVAGRFGKALRFDGDSSYAVTNWPGISGTGARTVSFWLRVNEAERPNPLLGWGLWDGAERMSFFGLRLGANGRVRIVSGLRWLEGTTSKLDDGEWHHVTVVQGDHQKGNWPVMHLFVDGEREELIPRLPMDGKMAELDTFYTVTGEPGAEPLVLGRFYHDRSVRPGHLSSFSGEIDEVIVIEGVCGEEQVRALYEGNLPAAGLDLE